MRCRLASLGLLLAVALRAVPSSALDCTGSLSDTDKVICSSAELQADDQTMESLLVDHLAKFLDDSEMKAFAAEQQRWRDNWVRSCAPGKSPADMVDCLRTKASARSSDFRSRLDSLTAYRGLGEPIELGGMTMVMKRVGSSCKLFIGDTPVMDCVYRIEPRARYREGGIDALAFVANGGGAGHICENFPMYVAVARSGQPAEVLRVPASFGDRLRGEACLDARRSPKGLRFVASAQAGEDGWTQEWAPQRGLAPPVMVKFAPYPGTTMQDRSGWLANNEQFYRALQQFAEANGLWLQALLGTFAFSSQRDLTLDDPPVRFSIINGCAGWSAPGRCSIPSDMRVIFDPTNDRFFFALVKNPKVTCSSAYHHNNTPGELENSTFLPPRREWPDDVFDALKRSYYQSS